MASPMHPPKAIAVRGARQHNLKDLDIDIPLNRLTVITGVSGSGKSSLAFDTLYAEGQRRYVETFSPYARQFMDRMDRPRADRISGVPPGIAIDRKDPVRTSRSTVGTMTEMTDYAKLLFSRQAVLHCHRCHRPVHADAPEHIWLAMMDQCRNRRLVITFPFQTDGGDDGDPRRQLMRLGYDRIWFETRIRQLDEMPAGRLPASLDVVADRIVCRSEHRQRVIDSLETALRFGGGQVAVHMPDGASLPFSNRLHCAACNIDYHPPLPSLFSFNSPVGACDTCRGFGRVIDIDMDLVIPDSERCLAEGAVKPFGSARDGRMEFDDLAQFCRRREIPLNRPFKQLTAGQKKAIIDGTDNYYGIRGYFRWLESRTYKMPVRVFLSRYRSYDRCPDCRGTRFKPEALDYRIADLSIADLYALNVDQALARVAGWQKRFTDAATGMVLDELMGRLRYLADVGLGYLTLDRQSRTLSGGEVQRVALASALGTALVHSLYVLDEPSIGLHPRDTRRLVAILRRLQQLSNTVVVVEHDPEIIRAGDHLIDLGPRAGEKGGQIMYAGPPAGVDGCLTGQYLSGQRFIAIPERRPVNGKGPFLRIRNAAANNLKSIDVAVPLGRLVCLTGVSGSGKSTLAEDVIYRGLARRLGHPAGRPGRHGRMTGVHLLDGVALVDQRPIGRTPRANVLTYTKALDPIRKLLAATAAARRRHLGPGAFSFNVKGGRCETCKGEGFEKIEMQFLSDVYTRCPDCRGRRFKPAVLAVTWQGRSIDDILKLTVAQALDVFADHRRIVTALSPLAQVGLDYIRLGQPVSTFSGGEAQRLKLSRYLGTGRRGRQLLIFDEPTTGLHLHDINVLMGALARLVQDGHTVLVVEHHPDVIKAADWVIDLGPEGGEAGGFVVATGTPEQLAACIASHTGRFLKPLLNPPGKPPIFPATGAGGIEEETAAYGAAVDGRAIHINGAREHNLKNLTLDIPHNQLVALTGVSGSGKSTLAFDILFAEGQRRYLESLAPYVRQYMKVMERPDVDTISGLSPTVAIEQRISHAGRRSTVATLTEIYHFLRLLFSKLATAHCSGCGLPLSRQTATSLVEQVRARYGRRKALVLAPKVAGRKGFHKDVLARGMKKGFARARIDGQMVDLVPDMALSRYHDHTIDLVVGAMPHGRGAGSRLDALVETALDEGGGSLLVRCDQNGAEEVFSLHGRCPHCGISVVLGDPRLFSFNSPQGACPTCRGLGGPEDEDGDTGGRSAVCPDCGGSRLGPNALAARFNGSSIWDMVNRSADDLAAMVDRLKVPAHQRPLAEPILAELAGRLCLMQRLGLGYLSLARSGNTLSGGESQRVRLAAQLGSTLTGVTYVLDEPTIGLHPRDNRVLVEALVELRDRGNTIVVVEHDEETLRAADTLIDLGPGAGRNGGRLVAQGGLEVIRNTAESVTGACLDRRTHRITSRKRPCRRQPAIRIQGARVNNLKRVNVRFPHQRLICVTGVSGSGKSSLVKSTLYHGLQRLLAGKPVGRGRFAEMTGWQTVDRVLHVDHSPIGRTPRSVPASYVGFLTDIRRLLAATPEARARGYDAGRFSFNVDRGRCPACKGQGRPKVEMSFLPNVYVPCPVCRGARFNADTLAVRYKGETMADILKMTFAEALRFFSAVPVLKRGIGFVCDVGLGYLQLGQPSPSLSGGEAQRIKLARQLVKPQRRHTVYVLDEPTTGLHLADVQRLIDVLQHLVDQGHTVVVIEHHLDMILAADYIIDLGPEGGDGGGRVVAVGDPWQMVRKAHRSHTGRFLKAQLIGRRPIDPHPSQGKRPN